MFCQYHLNVRNLYACGILADIKALFMNSLHTAEHKMAAFTILSV